MFTFVLNAIDEACYSREQCERLIDNVKNSTSDNDIINRDWLLIDVDPKRATGVSASNDRKGKLKRNNQSVFMAFFVILGFVCIGSLFQVVAIIKLLFEGSTVAFLLSRLAHVVLYFLGVGVVRCYYLLRAVVPYS